HRITFLPPSITPVNWIRQTFACSKIVLNSSSSRVFVGVACSRNDWTKSNALCVCSPVGCHFPPNRITRLVCAMSVSRLATAQVWASNKASRKITVAFMVEQYDWDKDFCKRQRLETCPDSIGACCQAEANLSRPKWKVDF